VPELMKHVRFEPVVPSILKGETMNAYEKRYPTPAADFELHEIHMEKGDKYPLKASTVDILIVIKGEVNAESAGTPTLAVHQGGSLLLTDGADIVLTSAKGALIYKATVPSA
jgi:mannose-6-phosphate isomerase